MRPTTGDQAEIEHRVLTTPEGQALLREVGEVRTPTPRDLERWRKTAPAAMVHAAIALADTRRRGLAKFSRADLMWFDKLGLEQSTAEAVARHKARRFAGANAVDLCCGIGGDASAIAEVARAVIAVDRDPGMLRRARWNAEVHGVLPRLLAVQSRAEGFPIPTGALVHVDPDRRARSASRSLSVSTYVPGLDVLRSLPGLCRGGALKLSPASNFDEVLPQGSYEAELISLGGECKEATLWFGDLVTCERRATTLPSGETWTGRPGEGACAMDALSRWIYDPDPSLTRAALLDGFAANWGLARFEPGIDLLTSSERVETPWLAAFEVLEVLPLDLKALKKAVARHDFGVIEIKPRGVDVQPETLRKQLNPRGTRPGTIFPIRARDHRQAILARRV